MAINVVVAGSLEDHAVLKYALSSAGQARVEVGTDGYRVLELAARMHPDVVVVDPAIPGDPTGETLVSRLKAAHPTMPVICWTARPDVDEASALLRAGATAYLLKGDGPTDLVRHIPAVLDGGLVIAPSVNTDLAGRFTHSIQRESELTRALAEATMQLQEVASSKDQFVANVNHELRTPVTIVKAVAHLLKSGRLSDEDQEQFVKRMDAAVDRLTSMVDEILSVSDVGQGRLALQPRMVDLAPLVDEACRRVAPAFPEATVEQHVPGAHQAFVDPVRISEAMVQLLDNACRYSPPGGRVIVSLRRVAEGVLFSVTDSGEGLPRDLLSKAFREPFVTGEEILRKERAGLGIGLHLARQIVILHGGILWADPLPSGGTRVAFCVPEYTPLLDDPRMSGSDVTDDVAGPSDEEVRSMLEQLLQD
ncbi:MAG: ATP-binding protein [Actinomycetota bacterium]